MSLELIIGPMFAGKSTEAIKRVREFQLQGISYFVITSYKDIRYDSNGESINTHSGKSIPARAMVNLADVRNITEFVTASHVVIEEAQFFPDLYDLVVEMVEKRRQHVTVFGLDGDSERRPFGQVLNLIPFADKYVKLYAECKLCGNNTPAVFTKRTSGAVGQVCVGGEESYNAVCRKHYLEAI
jgi:thymidine kinase